MNSIESLRQPQRLIPLVIVGAAEVLLILHGPLAQFANYHAFADRRELCGTPNAADVLSNLAFLAAATWGWFRLRTLRAEQRLALAWPGYMLFLGGLLLTAFGSTYYHWAPDDARLLWDRLPIALSCAGLLAGAFAEIERRSALLPALMLAVFAVTSVGWWVYRADLRPYLLLQVAPVVLIPLWQHLRNAPRGERLNFAGAVAVYAAARIAELYDLPIFAASGWVSGHTLKHLLAAAACVLIINAVVHRVRAERGDDGLAPLANRKS